MSNSRQAAVATSDHQKEWPFIMVITRCLAIGLSIFQLYTGIFQLSAMNQRVPHVCIGVVLIFLIYPFHKSGRRHQPDVPSLLMAASVVLIGTYVLLNWFRKVGVAGEALPLHELVMGALLIVLLIEAARRAVGWAFPLVAIGILIYAHFGEFLPDIIAHKNYAWERVIGSMFITTDGIFGMLAGISATFIYLFILFGALLREAGGGDFFIDLAYGLFGHVRGGPAKVAVVASSLFGMLSGSGTANVAGTGQITIPLMKKTGYSPTFAGAVETVASAGGLLMPPIMGSAVFIIMQNLGVGYFTIIKAASLTAVLYYLGLFIMIDLEAQKIGLKGVPKEEIIPLRTTLKDGWHFLIPIAILIYFIVFAKVSVTRAAFWACISIPLTTVIRPGKRMTMKQIFKGLENGAYTALPVIVILALAGIVVGMVTLTGLGLMMSSLLIELAHGNLFILLFLTMIASIILGMGVPPVAAYILLAILVVPALIRMGVYPLAAHLFVFYFSIVAGITPPMAPDAFIAAGISGAPMMKTALTACRLAIVIFILPYIFIYNNALLFIGSWTQIIWSAFCALVAVYILAICTQNYLGGRLPVFLRLILAISCLALVVPDVYCNSAGILVAGIVAFWRLRTPKVVAAVGE